MIPADTKIDAIQTDEEYQAAMIEIDRLFDAEPGTPEAYALVKLVELVMAYEKGRPRWQRAAKILDPANEAWD